LRDVNGTFASPNYLGSVTTAFTCRWSVVVPARRTVNLRLTLLPPPSAFPGDGSVSTGGASGCSANYVEVKVFNPLETLLGRYCTAVRAHHKITICTSRFLHTYTLLVYSVRLCILLYYIVYYFSYYCWDFTAGCRCFCRVKARAMSRGLGTLTFTQCYHIARL